MFTPQITKQTNCKETKNNIYFGHITGI